MTDNRVKFQSGEIQIEIALTGAELKGMEYKNTSYIWKGSKEYWNRSAPFLFPVVGTLKNKQTYINGKLYHIMQHGILRDQQFEVLEQTDNSISFINKYNDKTLEIYPFKYQAIITYTINGLQLTTKIEIKNLDNLDMPFNIGGHPGFNCPMFENDTFEDYKVTFEKPETFTSPYVTEIATLDFTKAAYEAKDMTVLNLKKSLFDIDTIIIPTANSKTITLTNKEGKGIKFEYPKFKTLAIWTPYNDAPFVCLEPWIGYNDRHDTDGNFITKDDIVTLSPNQEFTVDYTITILE